MSGEIVRRDHDAFELGKVFAESGMFPNVRKAAEAVVKIIAGQEFGLGPMAAMNGIHMVDGKPTLSANLIAGQIKRSRNYDYDVIRQEDDVCELEFFAVVGKYSEPTPGDARRSLGRTTFDKADAERAGLTGKMNWKKYPRAMYFARALTEGARTYCPDVLGGSPIYTAEELDGDMQEPVRVDAQPEMVSRDAEAPAEPDVEEVQAVAIPDADMMAAIRAKFTASGKTNDWLSFKLVELGVELDDPSQVPQAMGRLTLDQAVRLLEEIPAAEDDAVPGSGETA